MVALWMGSANPLCADTGPGRSRDGFTGPLAGYAASTQQKQIYVVKNDEKNPPDSRAVDGTEKTGESRAKQKTPTKKESVKKNKKQLKPFVPSETIPADQGVDFPYDI
jgi:hypothetical protein